MELVWCEEGQLQFLLTARYSRWTFKHLKLQKRVSTKDTSCLFRIVFLGFTIELRIETYQAVLKCYIFDIFEVLKEAEDWTFIHTYILEIKSYRYPESTTTEVKVNGKKFLWRHKRSCLPQMRVADFSVKKMLLYVYIKKSWPISYIQNLSPLLNLS